MQTFLQDTNRIHSVQLWHTRLISEVKIIIANLVNLLLNELIKVPPFIMTADFRGLIPFRQVAEWVVLLSVCEKDKWGQKVERQNTKQKKTPE